MSPLSKNYIANFVSKEGCFDLQFRRDVKYNRPNRPVYYGWKAQFVVMGKYKDEDLLRKIQNSLNCGRLHFVGENKIRYSVQSIDDLYNKVIPFFKEYDLSGNRKQNSEWWSKAIEILFQNKGKAIKEWKKEDFLQLIEIQKIMQKYKIKKIQGQKWLPAAKSIAEILG
ncbi:MAG: LAGLIDADG family homing endonuclease [bacterium]|nr:LAGLIDADG family homing endonuclease [bacterium]